MTAAQRHRLDNRVCSRGPQPERDALVTELGTAVHHGPLVQPEAVQLGGRAAVDSSSSGDESDGVEPFEQVVMADGDAVGVRCR